MFLLDGRYSTKIVKKNTIVIVVIIVNSLIFQFVYKNILNYCYFHTDCLTFFDNKNVGKIKKKH